MAKKRAGAAAKAGIAHAEAAGDAIVWEKGPKRPYISCEVGESARQASKLTAQDRGAMCALVLLGLFTRIYGAAEPHYVLFQEINMLAFINRYFHGFFFNLGAPPLAGLFYYLVSKLSGYNEYHVFRSTAEDYLGTGFPYVSLRYVSGLTAVLVVPLFFATLRACGVRTLVAAAVTFALVLENSLINLSRMFVADNLFLLFLAITVYLVKLADLERVSMNRKFAKLTVLAGFALGLAVSTKLVGLATLFWVLAVSVLKLWAYLGDLKISNCTIVKTSSFRFGVLTLLPVAVYFASCLVHLSLLPNYTKEASVLSTGFQLTLKDTYLDDIEAYVQYGNTITLRHIDTHGYLHSHPYNYRGGSQQQQVTVFDQQDYDNEFIIEPAGGISIQDLADRRIAGDVEVHLKHKGTGKYLRVNGVKPPISEQEYDFEVSCFANETSVPGEQETFILLMVSNAGNDGYLKPISTQFKLFSKFKRCTVLSHDLKLPEWGFNQNEVICIETPTESRTKFFFETNKNDDVKSEILELAQPSLLHRVLEVNSVMARKVKAGLQSKDSNLPSPLSWPFLLHGLGIFSQGNRYWYNLGNPANYFSVLVFIGVTVVLKLVDVLVKFNQDGYRFKNNAVEFALGWAVHFVPYVLLEGGEFFTVYYLPALYFGLLLTGVSLEYLLQKNQQMGLGALVSLCALGFFFYNSLSPLAYGSAWNEAGCQAAQLFSSWDLQCVRYST